MGKAVVKPKVKQTSITKRQKRRQGKSLVRTAPVRLTRAVTEEGFMVPEKLLALRAGYLLSLVENLTLELLTNHWTETDLWLYLQENQPTFAYKAWAETFGWPVLDQHYKAEPSYLPSRVGWLALEAAGRTLRSCGFRYDIFRAILAEDLTLLPPKAQGVPLRNSYRALVNYEAKHGGVKAQNFFELEPTAPKVSLQLLFSASDKQLFEMDGGTFKIKLPMVAQPQRPADWVWHYLPYKLPQHLEGTPCRPTLRIDQKNHLIADLPMERKLEVAELAPDDLLIQRCLAFDWGANTPLVGTCLWLDPLTGLPVSDGRPLCFKAAGYLGKLHRLQTLVERLGRKLDKQSQYLGLPVETPPELVTGLIQLKTNDKLNNKRTLLWLERDRVSARYNHLLDELAHLVSRWGIEQAIARHCKVIYLEDLSDLEPKMNKHQNRRFNLAIKGKIKEFLTYKAEEVNIKVVTVEPRGTSSTCPRCGKKNQHYDDASRKEAGSAWMFCADCKLSLQRDHSAAEHIGGRGLKSRQKNTQVTENVTRLIVPAPLRPDPATLPKRGPRAKQRRDKIESRIFQTGLSVNSLTAPASALSLKTDLSHRPLELRPGIGSPIQPKKTFNRDNLRPPRSLNGLRSAYLGLIKCSPIPGEYLTQNLNT